MLQCLGGLMSKSSFDSFREAVSTGGLEAAADAHLFDRVPFIFNNDWDAYRLWKRKFGQMLEVDARNITIIGSAATGFSLNPHKRFRAFNNNSDIDVAVISYLHFQEAWMALRKLNVGSVTSQRDRISIKEHRERYIYWGCIAADRILPYLPFVSTWTKALSEMAGTEPTEGRDITVRVYRDYDALRAYHMNSLREIQSELLVQ
jgi:hypothetical protein